jgi:hypothetical protein
MSTRKPSIVSRSHVSISFSRYRTATGSPSKASALKQKRPRQANLTGPCDGSGYNSTFFIAS